VSQDSGAAALFYEKACNGGNAAGCQKLASIGPSAASIPLLQKACDGNSASACQQLGLMYSMGRTDEDRASAAVYLRKACDAGHSDGCDMLADALDSGRGLPEDSSRASRLHQRAGFAALQSTDTDVRGCRDGQLAACVAFANLCLQPGGPPNWMRTHPHEEEQLETEALHVLDDLCAAEYWTGCTRLALFFSWSREPFPPRDASKATALYQRACDGGLWTACRDLASLYESGPGMPHDVEKAVQLHQRACDHGLQDSCSSVESLTRRPEPAPPVETDRFEPTQDGF
jgi:TPR repeat protein